VWVECRVRAAGFERHGALAVGPNVDSNKVICLVEDVIDMGCFEMGIDEQIIRDIGMYERAIGRHRNVKVDNGVRFVDVHKDALSKIFCLLRRIRHNDCDRVANVGNSVGCEYGLIGCPKVRAVQHGADRENLCEILGGEDQSLRGLLNVSDFACRYGASHEPDCGRAGGDICHKRPPPSY